MLPLPVLEEAQRDLVALPGVGMSVLEISHRSKTFEAIIAGREADIRKLAGIPANYQVLFLQGGASLQFSMVPMNLLAAGATADYIVPAPGPTKAVKEAKKVGTVNVARDHRGRQLRPHPDAARAQAHARRRLRPHDVERDDRGRRVARRCRTSATRRSSATPRRDMFSRPIDVAKYGLIYAGAQKNLGPAGVTLVIIRDDLLKRARATVAADDAQLRGRTPRTSRSTTRRRRSASTCSASS